MAVVRKTRGTFPEAVAIPGGHVHFDAKGHAEVEDESILARFKAIARAEGGYEFPVFDVKDVGEESKPASEVDEEEDEDATDVDGTTSEEEDEDATDVDGTTSEEDEETTDETTSEVTEDEETTDETTSEVEEPKAEETTTAPKRRAPQRKKA